MLALFTRAVHVGVADLLQKGGQCAGQWSLRSVDARILAVSFTVHSVQLWTADARLCCSPFQCTCHPRERRVILCVQLLLQSLCKRSIMQCCFFAVQMVVVKAVTAPCRLIGWTFKSSRTPMIVCLHTSDTEAWSQSIQPHTLLSSNYYNFFLQTLTQISWCSQGVVNADESHNKTFLKYWITSVLVAVVFWL